MQDHVERSRTTLALSELCGKGHAPLFAGRGRGGLAGPSGPATVRRESGSVIQGLSGP